MKFDKQLPDKDWPNKDCPDEELLDDACRREALSRLLASGALTLMPWQLANAGWFSWGSKKLATDRSIHSCNGQALVNGRQADLQTRIRAGDRIETRADSEIIFAVGADSFIMRSDSQMEITGSNFLIQGLRLLSGSLLSVFARRKANEVLTMSGPTATLGIRGTGVYMEAEPDLTYLCTCYGKVTLASSTDPDDSEEITATNHDLPRYITSKPVKGSRIRPAPVINHSNSELKLLEAIVGRKVPKGLGKRPYNK
jgi:hypothetical protein